MMPHIIYQTDGIVFGKRDFGEADRVVTLFTKDFGKIKAIVQGVRHLKSKLRYNLDLFSFSRFAMVAAGNGWRIIDAEEIESGKNFILMPENLLLFSRISILLDRMIQGEEKNVFLWNEIRNIFNALGEKNLAKEEIKNLEISSLLNILDNLGYIDKKEYDSKSAIGAINRAIKESML